MEKPGCIRPLRAFHGTRDRAELATEFAAWLVAMQEGFGDTRMADDFVAHMPRDAFRAVAPEKDLLFQVDYT